MRTFPHDHCALLWRYSYLGRLPLSDLSKFVAVYDVCQIPGFWFTSIRLLLPFLHGNVHFHMRLSAGEHVDDDIGQPLWTMKTRRVGGHLGSQRSGLFVTSDLSLRRSGTINDRRKICLHHQPAAAKDIGPL